MGSAMATQHFNWEIVRFTMVTSKIIRKMATEFKDIKTEKYIEESSEMISIGDKETSRFKIIMNMMENMKTIANTVYSFLRGQILVESKLDYMNMINLEKSLKL